jgi:hypothetical protein
MVPSLHVEVAVLRLRLHREAEVAAISPSVVANPLFLINLGESLRRVLSMGIVDRLLQEVEVEVVGSEAVDVVVVASVEANRSWRSILISVVRV